MHPLTANIAALHRRLAWRGAPSRRAATIAVVLAAACVLGLADYLRAIHRSRSAIDGHGGAGRGRRLGGLSLVVLPSNGTCGR